MPSEFGFSEKRFADFSLDESLLNALNQVGFTHCTPIQADSLPTGLEGGDVLGRAETGSGKTGAFVVIICEHLLTKPIPEDRRQIGRPRALIIAPTRELVMQIEADARSLSDGTGLHVVRVVGGEDIEKQSRRLSERPCDLLVATPGRLLDLRQRKLVHQGEVEILVLDEADRLLDMGFLPDLRRIVNACPPPARRQTLMFSATLSTLVRRLARQWMREELLEVEVGAEKSVPNAVQQMIYISRSEDRLPFLVRLLADTEVRALVFANRRVSVRKLYERLRDEGVTCAMLSGEMTQDRRSRALKRFRSGELRAMVATDVAGRGLHVEGVTHVINYDLPEEPEQYIHRIGRTGRIGVQGVSISFATEEQAFIIPDIEEHLGHKLHCELLPVID